MCIVMYIFWSCFFIGSMSARPGQARLSVAQCTAVGGSHKSILRDGLFVCLFFFFAFWPPLQHPPPNIALMLCCYCNGASTIHSCNAVNVRLKMVKIRFERRWVAAAATQIPNAILKWNAIIMDKILWWTWSVSVREFFIKIKLLKWYWCDMLREYSDRIRGINS